jgi:hypothetical protein
VITQAVRRIITSLLPKYTNLNDYVKEDAMGRACSTHMREENTSMVLARKAEVKSLVARPRYRWKYNIKMDLRKMGWGGTDRNNLAYDRDKLWTPVNTVINFLVS